MHASMAVTLLKKHQLLARLKSAEEAQEIKRSLSNMIINTDMALHTRVLDQSTELVTLLER